MAGGVVAIVVAAGSSNRMGAVGDKLLADLQGRPLLIRTLERFESAGTVTEVILVARDVDHWTAALKEYGIKKVRQLVPGGKERADSVWNGLNAIGEEPEVVLIHDGARPFVSVALIEEVARAAKEFGAVVPVTKIADTTKIIGEPPVVAGTLKRERVVVAQTPQGFRFPLLYESYSRAASEGFDATDDSSIVERYGGRVYTIPGEKENFKITDPQDLEVARAMLRSFGRTGEGLGMRVGIGYDIHRVVSGGRLVLGGFHVPCDFGLIGHSDADVLTHAIMDALLGAAGDHDIGFHFPDSDSSLEGALSLELLRRLAIRLKEGGWAVCNVDATVVAERPRLLPYADKVRDSLSSAIGIHREGVNVKFKTNEGIGELGEAQAIAAYAVACLERTEFPSACAPT